MDLIFHPNSMSSGQLSRNACGNPRTKTQIVRTFVLGSLVEKLVGVIHTIHEGAHGDDDW